MEKKVARWIDVQYTCIVNGTGEKDNDRQATDGTKIIETHSTVICSLFSTFIRYLNPATVSQTFTHFHS